MEPFSRRRFLQALVATAALPLVPTEWASTAAPDVVADTLPLTSVAGRVRPAYFTITQHCTPVPYEQNGWLMHYPGPRWTEIEMHLAVGSAVPVCGESLVVDEEVGGFRIKAPFIIERVQYGFGDEGRVIVTGRSIGDVTVEPT